MTTVVGSPEEHGPADHGLSGVVLKNLPRAYDDISADLGLPANSVFAERIAANITVSNVTVSGVVQVPDGNDVAEGATTQTAATTDTGDFSLIQLVKRLLTKLPTAVGGQGGLVVEGAASGTPVPVSVLALPLPTGAATAAKQPALGTAGTPSTDVLSLQGVVSGTPVPVSAATLPLPTGAALEAGNLAALLAQLQPLPPVSATLTGASPLLTLPLAGQRYIGFTLGTNDWGNSWGDLILYASTDGGNTFPTTLAFFDQGVNEIWYTVGLSDSAATTPTIYWAQADPGVTHVRLALGGAGPVHVRLFASATGPDIPQYVAGIGDFRPPLMVFVAALDGSGNLSPFFTGSQAASNGLAVTPVSLHDGAQGNLWNAAVTGAGGFSDPYTVTQGTTVAIVGHVSGATTISLQLSQDGTNFYTATLPAPVVLGAAGDFSFLATIPLNTTLRLQSSNSVTATATVMTSN